MTTWKPAARSEKTFHRRESRAARGAAKEALRMLMMRSYASVEGGSGSSGQA